MAESMRERMVLAIRDSLSGFPYTGECERAVDAILDVLAEPSEGMIHHGASALDHPSVYMGGPSQMNRKNAMTAWRAMISAIRSPRRTPES